MKKTTGDLIREARKAAGLTQEQAAARAGIRQGYWSQIESGARGPSLKTLRKVAKALKIEVAKLVD